MSDVAIDVVYVNYNSSALLRTSIESLLAAPCDGFTLSSIVVVDNASRPDQMALLDALPARVTVIRSPNNTGFAVGCNLGAKQGNAPAILFLNPDTHVLADTLPPLVYALRAHDGRALLGPRQFVDADCTLSFAPLHGTSLWGDVKNTLWGRGFAPDRSCRELGRRAALWRSTTPQAARALSGGALLIGRPAHAELGGFDERFFLYVEDTDLCVRAHARGIPVLYVANARVVHYGDQSSQQNEGVANTAAAAGLQAYLHKHHGVIARTARRAALALAQRLPDRQARWRQGVAIDRTFTFQRPSTRPWVVEMARSPLFDHGATAFPDGDTYRLPSELFRRLRPGTYFARIAEEVRADDWRERGLYVLQHADQDECV